MGEPGLSRTREGCKCGPTGQWSRSLWAASRVGSFTGGCVSRRQVGRTPETSRWHQQTLLLCLAYFLMLGWPLAGQGTMLMDKVKVNGSGASPVFQFLKVHAACSLYCFGLCTHCACARTAALPASLRVHLRMRSTPFHAMLAVLHALPAGFSLLELCHSSVHPQVASGDTGPIGWNFGECGGAWVTAACSMLGDSAVQHAVGWCSRNTSMLRSQPVQPPVPPLPRSPGPPLFG